MMARKERPARCMLLPLLMLAVKVFRAPDAVDAEPECTGGWDCGELPAAVEVRLSPRR